MPRRPNTPAPSPRRPQFWSWRGTIAPFGRASCRVLSRLGSRCAGAAILAPPRPCSRPRQGGTVPRYAAILVGGILLAAATASADVERVEVKSRRDVLGGRAFGAAGVYEIVAGTVHIAVDPANRHDRIIPDLDRAPKDARGLVHASADFYLLAPKDRTKGNHVLLLDIANRGNRLALRSLDRADRGARGEPDSEIGDAFLLARGYSVLWV